MKEFMFLQHAAHKSSRRSLQMRVKGLGQIFGDHRFFSIFSILTIIFMFLKQTLPHNNKIMCKKHHTMFLLPQNLLKKKLQIFHIIEKMA